MNRATVSTHVLDVALGQPAVGVSVTLSSRATQVTDAGGRIAELSGGGIELGPYQIVFDLGDYFRERPHLFHRVTLDLVLAEARHYHIPLLISPYSCAVYRGS